MRGWREDSQLSDNAGNSIPPFTLLRRSSPAITPVVRCPGASKRAIRQGTQQVRGRSKERPLGEKWPLLIAIVELIAIAGPRTGLDFSGSLLRTEGIKGEPAASSSWKVYRPGMAERFTTNARIVRESFSNQLRCGESHPIRQCKRSSSFLRNNSFSYSPCNPSEPKMQRTRGSAGTAVSSIRFQAAS